MGRKLKIIMPDEPVEFGKGYQKLAYHRIQSLRNFYDVTIVSIKPSKRCFDHLKKSKSEGLLHITLEIGLFTILCNLIMCILYLKPLQSALYTSPTLKKFLQIEKSDVNVFYLSRCFTDLGEYSGVTVLEFVDSMHKNFQSRLAYEKGLRRVLYRYEAFASKNYEKATSRKVDLSTSVSSDDAGYISDFVVTAPIGVNKIAENASFDTSKFITFSGKMDYGPNVEAVLWFYNNVWKMRTGALSGYYLKILGADPVDEIKLLMDKDPSVLVTGFVVSLIDELADSRVSISPMRSGSGMQFKILEAMAAGVPVITTKKGLGDIRAKPGEEILLADTALEYQALLTKLIEETEFARAVSNSGRNFIEENHTWENLNSDFVDLIETNINANSAT